MWLDEGHLVGWVQPTIFDPKARRETGGFHPPYEFSQCLSLMSGR